MPGRTQTDELRERVRQVRAAQTELLGLSHAQFERFCWDVAELRRDSIPGLLQRLRRESAGGELFRVDRRLGMLRRAEEAVVDQLDREQLVTRLRQGRLTSHMCDHWERTRPKEVPRVDGLPVWRAAFSVDVVG
jgi:hypothetical protein